MSTPKFSKEYFLQKAKARSQQNIESNASNNPSQEIQVNSSINIMDPPLISQPEVSSESTMVQNLASSNDSSSPQQQSLSHPQQSSSSLHQDSQPQQHQDKYQQDGLDHNGVYYHDVQINDNINIYDANIYDVNIHDTTSPHVHHSEFTTIEPSSSQHTNPLDNLQPDTIMEYNQQHELINEDNIYLDNGVINLDTFDLDGIGDGVNINDDFNHQIDGIDMDININNDISQTYQNNDNTSDDVNSPIHETNQNQNINHYNVDYQVNIGNIEPLAQAPQGEVYIHGNNEASQQQQQQQQQSQQQHQLDNNTPPTTLPSSTTPPQYTIDDTNHVPLSQQHPPPTNDDETNPNITPTTQANTQPLAEQYQQQSNHSPQLSPAIYTTDIDHSNVPTLVNSTNNTDIPSPTTTTRNIPKKQRRHPLERKQPKSLHDEFEHYFSTILPSYNTSSHDELIQEVVGGGNVNVVDATNLSTGNGINSDTNGNDNNINNSVMIPKSMEQHYMEMLTLLQTEMIRSKLTIQDKLKMNSLLTNSILTNSNSTNSSSTHSTLSNGVSNTTNNTSDIHNSNTPHTSPQPAPTHSLSPQFAQLQLDLLQSSELFKLYQQSIQKTKTHYVAQIEKQNSINQLLLKLEQDLLTDQLSNHVNGGNNDNLSIYMDNLFESDRYDARTILLDTQQQYIMELLSLHTDIVAEHESENIDIQSKIKESQNNTMILLTALQNNIETQIKTTNTEVMIAELNKYQLLQERNEQLKQQNLALQQEVSRLKNNKFNNAGNDIGDSYSGNHYSSSSSRAVGGSVVEKPLNVEMEELVMLNESQKQVISMLTNELDDVTQQLQAAREAMREMRDNTVGNAKPRGEMEQQQQQQQQPLHQQRDDADNVNNNHKNNHNNNQMSLNTHHHRNNHDHHHDEMYTPIEYKHNNNNNDNNNNNNNNNQNQPLVNNAVSRELFGMSEHYNDENSRSNPPRHNDNNYQLNNNQNHNYSNNNMAIESTTPRNNTNNNQPIYGYMSNGAQQDTLYPQSQTSLHSNQNSQALNDVHLQSTPYSPQVNHTYNNQNEYNNYTNNNNISNNTNNNNNYNNNNNNNNNNNQSSDNVTNTEHHTTNPTHNNNNNTNNQPQTTQRSALSLW